jgi:GAF domain-containing protein/HAMP domain-containing protein
MSPQADKATSPSEAKPKPKKRLAYTIALALLLFAVVPVSVMGLIGYLRSRNLLQEQVALQIYSISQGQTNSFKKNIQTKEIRLSRIRNRADFLTAAEHLINTPSLSYEQQLQENFDIVNRPDGQPLFDGFFLLDTSGSIYAASDPDWRGASLAESPDYRYLIQEGSTTLYDLSPILPNQFAVFTVKTLHAKSTGEDLGFLVGVTKSTTIEKFLTKTSYFNPSVTAYIISADDAYAGIDSYTKKLVAFSPSAEQQNALLAFYENPPDNEDKIYHLLEFKNHNDEEVVAQSHSINNVKSELVIEIPRKVAFGRLSSFTPFTIYLLLGTLFVIAASFWVAGNRIAKPLAELTNVAHEFSIGKWDVRASEKREDEIGELSRAFNQMAAELSAYYRSLEYKADERTEYIRTASEVAQSIVSTFNLDELLEKTARLVAERLNYYHVGIFMLDSARKNAYLKAVYGPAAEEMLKEEHHLAVDTNSIVGWVATNNRPHTASNVDNDPVHFRNELLPDTRDEVAIPISIGDTVLGVLDVQSIHPEAFDEATVTVLVTLANQIATAVQNVSLFESSDINLHELDRLYRASREIAQEKTKESVLKVVSRIFQDSPFSTAVFTPQEQGMLLYSASDPDYNISHFALPEKIDLPIETLAEAIKEIENIVETNEISLPEDFLNVPQKFGCDVFSLLPITQNNRTVALAMVGARHKEHLTQTAIQPYIHFVDMVTITLDKIYASEMTERRLSEMEAISITNQATAAAQDLDSLYPALHEQVRQVLGDYPFIIALYDEISNTIDIPYFYEAGKVRNLESFPLGEGLTSIIIRTGQPLMLTENTEKRAAALGAKLVGAPAKSWLGSPLQVQGKIIGAIIIQDTEHEHSFDENTLRFINTLATQVSGAIYNIQLLEHSRQRAIQLESAAEIARDISGSLHLDELLSNAVTMIRDRFNFYHASVFLIDPLGEYAIIREATGEAGAQLKRNGHKLGVGSKSIVGYVANRGENLVIEDTKKDATYYANPLLSETRAEAALPLKVGERILGVLDVQSVKPYAFPNDILQTLNIIADQLAVAVINTELFAETQEHLSQHRLLHHITTSAASGTTLEESLRGAVQGLQVTLGGDRVSILLVDPKNKNLIIGAAVGYSDEDIAAIKIPIGEGVTGWVAQTQKLLRVDNTKAEPRYISISVNTRSELAIPLTFGKEVLGVLNVESEQLAAYDEHDEEMLGTLAGSLAAIIANARLLQRVRRQAERERTLYEVTSKIRRSTNIQTILSTTANELSKAVGAQHAQIKITLDNAPKTEKNHE